MRPEDLAESVRVVLGHSPAFPGKRLFVDIIANPKAGGFKRKNFAGRRRLELEALTAAASSLPARHEPVLVRLHLTERCGHASAIAQRVIESSESDGDDDSMHLIFTAGGDGTSLETAERLLHVPEEKRDRFGILRLPFGTGNDGSEGRDLMTSLGRFLGLLRLERRAALRVTPAQDGGKPPLVAFNIASIGMDAYIADRTNKLKSVFPGDSYKFWVNMATLLYKSAYKVLPMKLRAWKSSGECVFDETRERLFVAMGASGNRQYGSNKRILPGEENVITVSQTSLFRMLLVKGPIEKGKHEGVREVKHFSASRIEIGYSGSIPLQCDGEVEILAGCDFPLSIELIPDSYNVIVPA
ncbi:MAG: diacylglycerol kinase family protein [Rectinema sp.]